MFKGITRRLHSNQRHFHLTPVSRTRTPFKLADIGEGITEVELIQWFVKQGDQVQEFSKICEVQSDKAAVEISSRYEGTISKLYYEVGETANVGSVLVDIETKDDVHSEEIIAPNSPALTVPIASTESLPIKRISIDIQNPVKMLTYASPAVRRIAKENSVDLVKVLGSGPKGRVLKGDVLQFMGQKKSTEDNLSNYELKEDNTQSVQQEMSTENMFDNQAVLKSVPVDVQQPLSLIQKSMFKSMTKSLLIPHLGFSDEICMNNLIDIRQEINQYISTMAKGKLSFDKISFMPIFLKAFSNALTEYPILNAKLMDGQGSPYLLYRASHNIGVAMDTPNGNIQNKSILEIASEFEFLKEKGMNGQLSQLDLSHGTITLSNVGNIGGTTLHPIIVHGEVCIGALGKICRVPRYKLIDGIESVCPTSLMNVSFSADHRIIDGATVARFVQLWKLYLEKPSILMLNLK